MLDKPIARELECLIQAHCAAMYVGFVQSSLEEPVVAIGKVKSLQSSREREFRDDVVLKVKVMRQKIAPFIQPLKSGTGQCDETKVTFSKSLSKEPWHWGDEQQLFYGSCWTTFPNPEEVHPYMRYDNQAVLMKR